MKTPQNSEAAAFQSENPVPQDTVPQDTVPQTAAQAPAGEQPPRRKMSARKKWAFRILAATVVPAALLAVLEVGLRVLGIGYPTAFFISAPQAIQAKGFGYFVNQDFGRRFFPPGLLRQPVSQAITVPKLNETYRIFVLGESAALGFPEPSVSFSRILEVLLQERYPNARFEVINTAMIAINSHVVLPIAQDCARHKPDLFVVLMGNNEIVGPFGASGVINSFSPNLGTIRNSVAAKTTGIGQLIQRCFPNWGQSQTTPRSWKGMSMFLQSQVRHSDPRLTAIRDHFSSNLKDLCAAAVKAGAEVLVCTVPVNLRDSAPFGSMHAESLSEKDLATWEKHYSEGIRFAESGERSKAIEAFESAVAIDPDYADVHFRLGRLYLPDRPQRERAEEHFRRALETDTLRFRSDNGIQQAIRDFAGGTQDRIHLVDAEKSFAAQAPDGVPGNEYFLEHVHFSFHGNYVLAANVFETLIPLLPERLQTGAESSNGPLSETDCAERLAFTDWNRLRLAQQIHGLLLQPPFTNQFNADERLRASNETITKMTKGLDKRALLAAVKSHERALELRPGDWMIRMSASQLFHELNQPEQAQMHLETIIERHPYVFLAKKKLGDLYSQTGQTVDAIEKYRDALKLAPDFAEAKYGLALALANEGRITEGLDIHEALVRSSPDRSAALEQMATFLVRIDRPDQADQKLEAALAIDPENAGAHAQRGALLANKGDRAGAVHHLEEALRIRPGWPQVTQLLATLKKQKPATSATRK